MDEIYNSKSMLKSGYQLLWKHFQIEIRNLRFFKLQNFFHKDNNILGEILSLLEKNGGIWHFGGALPKILNVYIYIKNLVF